MKELVSITGDNGILEQWFNGKRYRCYEGRNYFTKHKYSLHVDVWIFFNGEIPDGYEIHHIDENTHNNNIQNLEIIKSGLHQKIHSLKRFESNKEWFLDFQKKGVQSAKEWHSSEDGIKWHSEHAKNSWKDRQYITKVCKECGKDYQTRHVGKSFFCHLNCRAKNNRRNRNAIRKSIVKVYYKK
jgi:hypothetical protein